MKNAKFGWLTLAVACLSVVNFGTGWAKSTEEKIKQGIDDIACSLKKDVDKMENNLVAIQGYLDNYHWKGVIQNEASSGAVTLKHVQLNGHSKAVVVRPGERIEGSAICNLNRDDCSALSLYRVILGFKGKGAQTTIANELGIAAGESLEYFALIAPKEPGLYELRFRLVENAFGETAFKAWKDPQGNEPDGTTTVGLILVKS